MKKLLSVLVLLVVAVASAKAQDYKKIREALTFAQTIPTTAVSKLEEAKAGIDKMMSDPKAAKSPETFLYKAEVYGAIAGNPELSAKYPLARFEAYDAFNQYRTLDPSEKKLSIDEFPGVNNIFGIYMASRNAGASAYSAGKFDSAFNDFSMAANLGDVFTNQKWWKSNFDTLSYLFAGASAQNAKKDAEAVKYYSAITSRKIAGSDYYPAYHFLALNYYNSKNQAELQKHLGVAKQVYPDSTIWGALESNYMLENLSLDQMSKKYDEESAANKINADSYVDYGNYFMSDKRVKELDETKRAEYTRKALDAFSRAYALDSSNGIASYNAGIVSYSLFENEYETVRKITGATAEIKAKRAQAYKSADAAADKTIDWFEKCYRTLSAKSSRSFTEKKCLNTSIDRLYNLYEYKKDRSRGVNVKDYDKYDAKFKFYDSMHNKF